MKNKKQQLFKTLGIMLALSILLPLPAAVLAADDYPSKPIRLIVYFAPGGANDIVGRLIAAKLTERLGRPVVVENRPGAGGMLGTEVALKANPDGYTLLFASISYAFNPALYKSSLDPEKDCTPIAKLGTGPMSLVVHPSVPANSVQEFIALAKQKPGKLIFACSGAGSNQHLAAELFKTKADIDCKIVQFKGGGPAMIDLLGGHSHAFFGSLPQNLPHIKSGKVKVLGTGGKKRSAMLPDVPTIAEAGVSGYEAVNWWGIIAPAGTPVPIVEKLDKELKAISTSDELKTRLMNEGAEVDYMGPAEFGIFIIEEITKWGKVIKEANINIK